MPYGGGDVRWLKLSHQPDSYIPSTYFTSVAEPTQI
jgi:hypothetical protein